MITGAVPIGSPPTCVVCCFYAAGGGSGPYSAVGFQYGGSVLGDGDDDDSSSSSGSGSDEDADAETLEEVCAYALVCVFAPLCECVRSRACFCECVCVYACMRNVQHPLNPILQKSSIWVS